MNVKETVFRILETLSKNPIPGETEEARLNCYYLDSGVIDSHGIVEMIMELEGKYGIYFTDDHLQSYEFQTIGGLITLVESMIKEKQ
jgi:acyl carrier protein